MAMPLRQSIKVATYLAEQKLRRRDKFPLIVELEPLYACNLKCEGCGKIQHPAGVLRQRMPVAQAACAGVYVHLRAGQLAAAAHGPDGVIASDVIGALPAALSA